MNLRVASRTARGLGLLFALASLACAPPTGHPGFASPHASPIALSPILPHLYVVNTAADTLDIIDTNLRMVIARVSVGIDPVSVAVRPDGLEVWVSNHVSDSVSVVDTNPLSPTEHHVIATVQSWDQTGRVTTFDEPVGIAFADNAKAYVVLSSRNEVAVVDVASRAVTSFLDIAAQDPRAVTVRDGRLYVIPFESGNRTQLSGCIGGGPVNDPDNLCTFDVIEEVINNNVLTRNMVGDVIREPRFPDHDLFVFDTSTDELVDIVDGLGTLLYGIAVDSQKKVFVALTEARNDANGRAGTDQTDLIDLDNRMFLNQVATVDCPETCDAPSLIDLEPLPPDHPDPGMQLATPFGIQISDDDQTLVVTAAGSNRLFTMDAASGDVLGRIFVEAVPRGVALKSQAGSGAPQTAWVLNAVENSVSAVDVSEPANLSLLGTIPLDDPTHPDVKAGRAAFNDALGSTTGTFSCESCHPDGNTDQVLWVLGARCDLPGCDQVQPRSTMPIRGLRDTLPLHWDGVPGDPFGGINTENILSPQPPNCTDEHSCFRHLVDGAMSGTMCDQAACPTNSDGLLGALGNAERDAMAVFLRSVPYPPPRSRPIDDQLSASALTGFDEFLSNDGNGVCTNVEVGCHQLPFWNGTNVPGSGMDAPTFRGMTDRWLTLPNGRVLMIDILLVTAAVSDVPWDRNGMPDELVMWALTFGTEELPFVNRITGGGIGGLNMFQMFEEATTGFAGAFARQVTLNADTTSPAQLADTEALLDALEEADDDGVVNLWLEGVHFPFGNPLKQTIEYQFAAGLYAGETLGSSAMTRAEILQLASEGKLVATATARLGPNVDVEHPQPGLWTPVWVGRGRHLLPHLPSDHPIVMFGRHVAEGALVIIDGETVGGSVTCATGGTLPTCDDEEIEITLDEIPPTGQHLLQVMTPNGLLSNEVLIFVD